MQRFSRKRQAIYDCLCSTDIHPTSAWIYQQLSGEIPDLSLATVYRNLSQLKEAGMISSVGVINGHEHFDGKTEPHAHIVCSSCGAILDVMGIDPAKLYSSVQKQTGCRVSGATIRFSGICPACQNADHS